MSCQKEVAGKMRRPERVKSPDHKARKCMRAVACAEESQAAFDDVERCWAANFFVQNACNTWSIDAAGKDTLCMGKRYESAELKANGLGLNRRIAAGFARVSQSQGVLEETPAASEFFEVALQLAKSLKSKGKDPKTRVTRSQPGGGGA